MGVLLMVLCLVLLTAAPLAAAADGEDDYPAWLKSAPQDSLVDPWGFWNRECTSFVAWRMNRNAGDGAFTNTMGGGRWGDASNWRSNAEYLRIRVDSVPAAGAIAWFSEGHVAYVQSVNDGGTVTIEEYNYGYDGKYYRRTIPAASVSAYIHFCDLVGTQDSVLGGISGDINGDGLDDPVVLYDYGNSTTGLWVFRSDGSGAFSPRRWWLSGTGGFSANRSQLAIGDFNGDGYYDVAVLYDYGNSTTGLWVFRSDGSGAFSPRRWWLSGTGGFSATRSKLSVGDANGDGYDDVAVLYDYGNSTTGLWVFRSDGSGAFSPRRWWLSGTGGFSATRSKLTAGDYTGDGLEEPVVLYDYGNSTTGLWTFRSDGSGAFSPRRWWLSGTGGWSASRSQLD